MSDAPDTIFLHRYYRPFRLERYTLSTKRTYADDIAYVRRDEVCVWRYEYDQIDDAETGGCYRPTSHEGGVSSMDWTWCPYCGKRIKAEG